MISLKKAVPIAGIAALLATTSAYAAFWNKKTETETAFCSKLKDPTVYDEAGLDPYKMLISGTDDWIFRTENDFRSDFAINAATTQSLLRLQHALKEKNIDLVIAFPPSRGLVHANHLRRGDKGKYGMKDPGQAWENYAQSIAALRAKGLNIVGIDKSQATDDFFYKRNHHWTAVGAAAMAENVSAFVKTLPSWSAIGKTQYTTTAAAEPAVLESSFEKAFKKVCQTELPPEEAKTYTTAEAGDASAQELFDDRKTQQVVLLGTSNSVQESSLANFEGFLKQDLSADILNLSFIAGGIDTSIISFLNSDSFRNGQTRIVIWEVPGYYDFNIMDDKLFAQLLPAVHGSCGDSALASTSVDTLPQGRTTLFDFATMPKTPAASPVSTQPGAPQPQAAANAEKYVHISFADGVQDSFRLRFDYGNQGTQIQDFSRSDNYPVDGEFYTMFPKARTPAPLKRIILESKTGIPGNQARVEICPLAGVRKDIYRITSSMPRFL